MSEEASKDSPEQAEFRQYCRDWLKDNHPGEPPVRLPLTPLEIMTQEQLEYLQAWQLSAYKAGLVGCDYPVECGGGGRTDCQRVANGEMQAAQTPFFPNVIGLGMAAPTVFYHGSDELKAQLLPRLFSGEDIWCQGFSEPGAGSDLASVQTFAEQQGRQVGDQRPQGLDLPGALRRVDDPAAAHRQIAQVRRPVLLRGADPLGAGQRGDRAAADQDHWRDRLQRGDFRRPRGG